MVFFSLFSRVKVEKENPKQDTILYGHGHAYGFARRGDVMVM
jgi:predicted phosphodiesterase